MSKGTKMNLKTPGPFWIWAIASIVFAQLVKRGVIGWPLPKNFDFGNRMLENIFTNLFFGLPVIAIFLLITLWMNLKSNGKKNETSKNNTK